MRLLPYLSIILFTLPVAALAGAPSLFDTGNAGLICSPRNKLATEIVLYNQKPTSFPQIDLKIWERIKPGDYVLGNAQSGYGSICNFPSSCIPLEKVKVHIETVDFKSDITGYVEWIEQGVKNHIEFTAPWDEEPPTPCA